MLDPFLPEKPEDVERLKAIQQEIHESFIALVKSRRGGKLDGRETALFSGEYWTGQRGPRARPGRRRSATCAPSLRERYGDKVRTPLIARARPVRPARRRASSGSMQLLRRPSLADDVVSTLEARAMWARYGL